MISSRIRPDTNIKYKSPENAKATKATATNSVQRNNSVLSRAFAAQRRELFEQPSSSKDLRFTALDILEQRGFKPALGGLEIPLTGKAMGGMRRRVNAPPRPDTISEAGARQFQQEARDIENSMAHKRLYIRELNTYLARPDLTEEQRQSASENLERFRQELVDLQARWDRLPERIRQAERGRWQRSDAGSSYSGSQRR